MYYHIKLGCDIGSPHRDNRGGTTLHQGLILGESCHSKQTGYKCDDLEYFNDMARKITLADSSRPINHYQCAKF
jgi:hypothetical protein